MAVCEPVSETPLAVRLVTVAAAADDEPMTVPSIVPPLISDVAATNVGERSGSDVVQVYVRDPLSADEPPEQLRAFARVQLSPGQRSVVHLTFPWSQLQVFEHGAFTLVAGDYGIGIGQSSADIEYESNVHTTA